MTNATVVAALAVSLAADSAVAFPGTQSATPKRPWIGEACKQEFSTLCSDLPVSSRREQIIECLKKHPESLSHECSEAIADRPGGPGQGRHERQRRGRMGDDTSYGRVLDDGSGF
jgi:Cysteine rich repeat